jgi:hypothetical protein
MGVIHIRHDDEDVKYHGLPRFVCGLAELPPGDKWFGAYEPLADVRADCPGCNPNPRRLGTPLSELTGRNGGNAEWRRISASWGYD